MGLDCTPLEGDVVLLAFPSLNHVRRPDSNEDRVEDGPRRLSRHELLVDAQSETEYRRYQQVDRAELEESA